MWFAEKAVGPDWSAARRHLRKIDPVIATVLKQVGPCTLQPRRDPFVVLCQSIFSQQISVAIAATLFGRFRDQFPRRRPTPTGVVDFLTRADPQLVRHCGISRQKQAYLLDLARHFADGRLRGSRLKHLSDEQVIESLTTVHGVGRWTAEMFLIFTLNRPDVLPVDDLGLLKGMQRAYELDTLPTKSIAREMGEPWRPYRTIGTWYLWRMQGPGVATA